MRPQRSTDPETQAQYDLIAKEAGRVRDPVAEEEAWQRGLRLWDEVPRMDDAAWTRVTNEVRAMGPIERVLVWTAIARSHEHGGMRDRSVRARYAYRNLTSLVLEVFGMGAGQ